MSSPMVITLRKLAMSLVVLFPLLTAACSTANNEPSVPAGDTAGPVSADPIVLTIAVQSNEPFFDSLKAAFEASHPGIEVNFKEYVAMPGDKTAAGASAQIQRDMDKFVSTVTTELASGKGPDMLVTNYLPYKKYADKNMLADIGGMMNSDPDFKLDDYYANVFDTLKYNGKYVTIPTSVQFTNLWIGDSSAIGQSDVGDKEWSWQQFIDRVKPLVPSGGSAISQMPADTLLQTMLNPGIGQFVDQEAGKASFDGETFIHLLKQAKQMVDDGMVAPDAGTNLNLFLPYPFRYLSDLITIPQVMLGAEGAVYRAPGAAPGYAFRSNLTLSINDKSPNKQAAWEFLKFILSDEIQSNSSRSGMRGMPVSKKAFHGLQEALKQQENTGATSKKTLDGQSIVIEPPTDEEIDKLESYMTGINAVQETDSKIAELIAGETDPFFKGQKSAEETAAAIQGKVTTYLNE